jgi:hypothetical protein
MMCGLLGIPWSILLGPISNDLLAPARVQRIAKEMQTYYAERRELQAQQPEAVQSAQVLSLLPKAAATYRRQIELGLSGNAREALKARVFLRDWFGGAIRLVPRGWRRARCALGGTEPVGCVTQGQMVAGARVGF